MFSTRSIAIFAGVLLGLADIPAFARERGVLLEKLTWVEAERVLSKDATVVIPLGAASKEHGPHLPLNTDWIQAEYLKNAVLRELNVVVAPTLSYGFYPAFLEYPGSVSLRLETSRDEIVEICRSLARYGPRRFYVLNTGISTIRSLRAAAGILEKEGILLRYTDLTKDLPRTSAFAREQEGGTHADIVETSMMLFIAPGLVNMRKAVKDFRPGAGPLTRNPSGPGVYSPTGIWGDPTRATREKGKRIVTELLRTIREDIEVLRASELPTTQ